MLAQRIRCPGAERIHHCVEALQIGGSQVKQVFRDHLAGGGSVRPADHGGDIQTTIHGLLDNQKTRLSIGADNSDFHVAYLHRFSILF